MATIETHPQNGAASASTPKPVICVFCGANPGATPAHMEAARALARVFHERGISLVYGGGTVGLMGEVAKTLVSLSGPSSVHGIIPAALVEYERAPTDAQVKSLEEQIDSTKYGRTTIVKDMHTRKALMAKNVYEGGPGSGFIALSGGYGTLEELMEVTTWHQLGIHSRGIAVLNVEGYWDGLLQWVRTAVKAGFVKIPAANIIVEGRTAEEAVDKLASYTKSAGQFKLKWDS